jgi:hypothetical protein
MIKRGDPIDWDTWTREALGVDQDTFRDWGEAIGAAIMGDRRELVWQLRHGKAKITPDVAEFIAWLLDEKDRGRPKLPDKFKLLRDMASDPAMYDAIEWLTYLRNAHVGTGKPPNTFPITKTLEMLANFHRLDVEALRNKDQRSKKKRP